MWKNRYSVAILTASDKCAAGGREDKSGAVARRLAESVGCRVEDYRVLPDDRPQLSEQLRAWSGRGIGLVLTTGGTGLSPRDCMPEATLEVADRLVPGIPEAMRAFSMRITDRAMLSRAVAAVCKGTLIINLPGSPKAVEESLTFILPALEHAMDILKGNAAECARDDKKDG